MIPANSQRSLEPSRVGTFHRACYGNLLNWFGARGWRFGADYATVTHKQALIRLPGWCPSLITMTFTSRDALERRAAGTALVRRLTKVGGAAAIVAVAATAVVVANSLPGRSVANASHQGGSAPSTSAPVAPSQGGSTGAPSVPAVTSGGS